MSENALPNGWATTSLGEISERGIDQGGPYSERDPFCYVDISSIDRSTKCIVSPQILANSEAPSRAKQRLDAGDVLVSMTRPNLNAVSIVSQDLARSIGSTGFHVLRSRHVAPLWLSYRVQASDFVSAMSMKVQGALYPAVRPADIAQFATSIPPRQEQDRIVAEIEKQFTRLDAATAALKRVQANLKRYRASVLKAACEGRLVPTEAELARKEGRDYEPADKLLERILRERRARWEAETLAKMIASGKPPKDNAWKQKYKEPSAPDTSNLPALPEGWCWAAIDQLPADERNSITDGPFGSNLKSSHYTDSGPRVVRLQNVGDGVFREAEAHISEQHFRSLRKHEVHAGDIVIAALGDPAPRACIVPEIGPAIVKADCIRFKPAATLVAEYVSSALNSDGVRKRTSERIHGVGRPRLNLQEIREIAIPLPPVVEQRRLASRIDQIMTTIDRQGLVVEATLRNASAVRRSILADAFGGSLVPQDPADEPASVLLERIRRERVMSGALAGSEPIGKRGRKVNMTRKDESAMKKTLLETLNAAATPLTPEDLFRSSGHQIETIDEYYAELKAGIDAGQIEEIRVGDDRILLRSNQP